MVGTPEENALVFRAGTNVSTVRGEASLDLTGQVGVAFILAHHAEVPQVVQADPAVVAGDQDPVLGGHRLYPSHFPAPPVLTARALDVDCGVVFQLVRGEEYHSAIVGSDNNKLS